MLDLLYVLIISPIELIVEITYTIMSRLIGNSGIAIIAVSLVIQTLVLPLYKSADDMQSEERKRQSDMAYWVNHIKKTFRGEERYMMLSTYYREVGYKSWYAIKSSASLLLQIPFFIAAYHYLSNLFELNGKSFGFISDLSKPDMAITIAGITINILPILMTVANVLSGILYTKGTSVKEKAQVYGLAVAFLVLLYNSPSGLVLYWTVNNVYSLAKNLIKKNVVVEPKDGDVKKHGLEIWKNINIPSESVYILYILSAVLITVFAGALIPINVIKSSATEFISTMNSPVFLIIRNTVFFAGIFILWGSVFFAFMNEVLKRFTTLFVLILSIAAIANYLLFGNNYGRMSALFVYDTTPDVSKTEIVVNLVILIAVIMVVGYLGINKYKIVKSALGIIITSSFVFCVIGMGSVLSQVHDYDANRQFSSDGDDTIFKLSRNGKNVVVLFMDRAISGYLPFIFEEKPELAEAFDGFTYYPNALSFGMSTNYGSPSIYGGYEYTPYSMNQRPEESLKDKHNEALLVMPRIFAENGFEVCVTDPPYAGDYTWTPNMSIYDGLENVTGYITEGMYMDEVQDVLDLAYQPSQRSNLFWYAVMRTMPVMLQKAIYNNGNYLGQDIELNMEFLEWYSVLLKMDTLTEISDDNVDNCILFHNCATHDTSALEVPDYVPKPGARNKLNEFLTYYSGVFTKGEGIHFENLNQIKHYQSNVASLAALGEWFGYLKENNCWDNTRIVIVADHGNDLKDIDKTQLSEDLNIEAYNPLFLVKDFNEKGFKVSDEFVTTADVISVSADGIIDNLINPYTGKEINELPKKEKQMVTTSGNFSTTKNNGNTFDTSDGVWYEVTPSDIFDINNWKKVE